MAEATESQSNFPSRGYAWYCMTIIVFAYFFGFLDRLIIGFLTEPIKADLGLSDTQMGIIQGLAFAVFYSLFVIPIGWAADRYNRKWMLTAGTTMWSLFTAGCGLMRSFGGLFTMRVGVGIGEATLNPCTTSLIGDLFEPRDRPKAFGYYTMATAFGTGLASVAGGIIIGITAGGVTLPILGTVPGWQAVLIIIGLAGLIPAILMATTVKEPSRKEMSGTNDGKATTAEIIAFVKSNWVTLACHNFGVAFIVMAVYGWVSWLAPYFSRIHGLQPNEWAIQYGMIGMVFGIASALSSGYVTNWFKDRGNPDGALRTVMWGGVGLVFMTTVAPLMPTPALAIGVYAAAGMFANWPPAQALAAINDITPNQLRGTITSIYILIIGIGGAGLGPFAIGLVTDSVFMDESKIHYSMALVTGVMGFIGVMMVAYGLKAYRESLSRVDWMTPQAAPAE